MIYLGVSALRLRERVWEVIAHELIHHWEHTVLTTLSHHVYPNWIDDMIRYAYSYEWKERHWRNGHSQRFIAMAYLIAVKRRIHVASLLSGLTEQIRQKFPIDY